MARINPAYETLEKQLSSVMEPQEQPQKEDKNRNPEYTALIQELSVLAPDQFQDETFFDKVVEAAKSRGQEISETASQYMKGGDPNALQQNWGDYNKTRAPDTLEALTQIAGNIVGFAWDIPVAGFTESVENLWQLAPETFRNDVSFEVKQAAKEVAKTTIGKAIVNAAQTSQEELQRYAESYPQEYKTLAAGLNIATLGFSGKIVSNTIKKPSPRTDIVAPTKKPLEGEFISGSPLGPDVAEPTKTTWKDFVTRREGDRLSGRDKDLWTIIEDDSEEAIKRAIEQGKYTKPGVTGTETRLLTPEEEIQLASVKKIKNFGSLDTYRQNYSAIREQLTNVTQKIEDTLSNVKGDYTWPEIDANLQQALTGLSNRYKTEYLKQPALQNFEQMAFKAKELIDKNGTSALGIHKSRVEFSRFYNKYKQSFEQEGISQQVAELNFKAIYRQLNNMVDSLDNGVTRSMRTEQSGLIMAGETVLGKAVSQDRTAIGRFLQSIGITSHGKTSAGKYASIRSDIPLLLVSPFYFLAKPIRKATTKSKPFREGVQEATYAARAIKRDPKQAYKLVAEELKSLRAQGAEAISKLGDKELQKALVADTKTLTLLIKSLEEGSYEPTEEEERIINEWLSQ